MIGIIISILIGAFVGWIAGCLMHSKHGFWFSCLIGIVGGALGSWLAGLLGIASHGLIGTILIGVAGTCILIAIVRVLFGKKF